MAKTTIKITTGINIEFSRLSDYQVVNLRLEYRNTQKNYLIAGLVSFTIAFLLVILNESLYNDVVLWMGIIGGLSGMAGIWFLWWTKIYADTRRKCERELNRRVAAKQQAIASQQPLLTQR